jgi:hypothetical protein
MGRWIRYIESKKAWCENAGARRTSADFVALPGAVVNTMNTGADSWDEGWWWSSDGIAWLKRTGLRASVAQGGARCHCGANCRKYATESVDVTFERTSGPCGRPVLCEMRSRLPLVPCEILRPALNLRHEDGCMLAQVDVDGSFL